jgi:hypothetical protein
MSFDRHPAPGSLRAGDRAPDAPGRVDREGTSFRLFDVFRGPQPTLIAFGEGREPGVEAGLVAAADAVRAVGILHPGATMPGAGRAQMLMDSLSHANSAREPGTGALFAVRPDGVIGFADSRRDPVALVTWLRQAGLAR